MTTEGAISRAVDRVSGEANPAMKEKALNTVAKLPTSQTYGLPNAITLKVTAKYMMTDVVTDPQTMACDIYLAVEIWSCLQDLFNMNNFEEIVRTNGPKQYSANLSFDVSAMIRHNLEYSNPLSYSEISGTEHCEAVSFEVNNVKNALYRSC
ncbi:unnamed protein product [Parnassius apollo]|uniref:(apollo) hypothetical protein n=1 Tax=Parnassius apollo TaxID=110799 RepID=A0A8S3Y8F3_PARAO|nr:unnamed protein product [Parnassius apollo]